MTLTPHEAFVALGGNLGDPAAAIARALDELTLVSRVLGVAPLFRSPAEPDPTQPDYLNTAAQLVTHLEPEELLAVTKQIEWQAGRRRSGRNAPRPLDIDLLLFDDRRVSLPELTLPHPRLLERAFVLAPLAALAPRLRLPPDGATAREHLLRLPVCRSISQVGLLPWPDRARRTAS